MTSVDRYGFEMSAQTGEGPRPVRLAFAAPVSTPDEARGALISMLKDARRTLARWTFVRYVAEGSGFPRLVI